MKLFYSSAVFILSFALCAYAVPPDMVLIPGGTFQMGNSLGDGGSDEIPVHTVTLDSFYMGKYDITNSQYCAFLNSTAVKVVSGVVYASTDSSNKYPYCYTSPSSVYFSSPIAYSGGVFSVRTREGRSMSNDPVVCVTWYGAVVYCNWQSQQEAKEQCYNLSTWVCDFNKYGYRLPNEAEWEYAARGGLSGKRFPWGDTISHSQANYYSDPVYSYDISPTRGWYPIPYDFNEPHTSPVGSLPANGFGLHDMAGNAWQWCNDWYSAIYYSSSPVNNPTGPTSGTMRVSRNGCIDFFPPPLFGANGCRVSCRMSRDWPQNITWYYNGFRVVLGGCGSSTPVPAIVSIDPEQAGLGQNLTVTIQGQNTRFAQGDLPAVWLSKEGSTILASSATIFSDTLLSADFTIPSDAIEGLWDVYVNDGIDGPLKLEQGFLIVCSAPYIESSGQPQSQSIVIGQNVQFTVQPAGSPPFIYQWQKKNGEIWEDISGAQSATLTINSVQLSDAGEYRAVVTNSCNTATSSPATLTVTVCKPHGFVSYVDGGQAGPVEGIPVYVYQEGVAEPIWQRTSGADGHYQVDTYNNNYNPNGPQRFYVEAKWEDELIRVKDNYNWAWIINWSSLISVKYPTTSTYCECSQMPSEVNLIFNYSDALQDYVDANATFRYVHDANKFVKDNFQNYSPRQVTAIIHAQLKNGRPGQYDRPATIEFARGRPPAMNGEFVWHEYGHAIHDQLSSGFEIRLSEGWAYYFQHFAMGSDLEYNCNYNTCSDIDDDHTWGHVYSGIFFDIEDPCNPDDQDGIDGQITHHDKKDGSDIKGKQMVWKVIMEDGAVNIEDFYSKFVSRYENLGKALMYIYIDRGVPLPRIRVTNNSISYMQTQIVSANVESTIKTIGFNLLWLGSDLDFSLIEPNGTIIDPCYAESYPEVTYVKTATKAYYLIDNPSPGNWQMKVTAVDVPPEGENYTATAYLTTDLYLLLTADKENYEPNEPISLTAQLFYDSNSYSDANVTARIERPDGNETITLYDDGLHNDGNSNDGNYANAYTNTAIEGQYNVVVTASGWNPFNEPFVRETSKTVQVMRLPDLAAADLQTNDELTQGELTLSATIRNNGTAEANDINVAFYDVNDTNVIRIDPNIIIDRLEPNETNTVSVVWNATYGRHQIFVVIDPNNLIAEKDETNNYTSNVFLIDCFDFNFDGITDFTDFAILANKWLDTCTEPVWCDNFDIDRSGQIDIQELATFAQHWLEGVEP